MPWQKYTIVLNHRNVGYTRWKHLTVILIVLLKPSGSAWDFFPDSCVPGAHAAELLNLSAEFRLVLLLLEVLSFRWR